MLVNIALMDFFLLSISILLRLYRTIINKILEKHGNPIHMQTFRQGAKLIDKKNKVSKINLLKDFATAFILQQIIIFLLLLSSFN